ncbi:actin-related protein 6 [Contarinia nasturtii]|uniref:actin-related protein 6 n=1 Tax=Contarinia nasturtii TaxID=265458 RepID=UPI0012D46C48|nr:actin-related protein 6 [Contarinia nasturtii]
MVMDYANIIDNGAYSIKIGTSVENDPKIIPNCIMKAKSERRRPFIGDQIEECRDASGLFYILCFQRGYLVNWDVQKTVWDYAFSKSCASVDFTRPTIITEPQFNFTSIQEAMTEIFFEEFDCETLLRTTAADLAYENYATTKSLSAPHCCIVIDMGYSFTHIIPFVKGERVKQAIRRIDIGGKVLTNHLKEIISYRQLNVMDESYVINQVKEDSCYVSQNFYHDMDIAKKRDPKNKITREYVLPDFTTIKRGFLREPVAGKQADDQQTLRLSNERFTIPELLFHPSDVGIRQMGLAEVIFDACKSCPEKALGHLLPNIVCIGGCAMFPGMAERLQKEVRALAPDYIDVAVTVPKNPITYAWQGGKILSQQDDFLAKCMTREQYEEEGVRGVTEKFAI